MSYSVIKTVRGRKYLYVQESHREGRFVRTKSRYVGPVDTVTGEVIETSVKDPQFVEKYRQEVSDRVANVAAESPAALMRPEPTAKEIPEVGGSPQGLTVKIDCERFTISKYSLEQDWIKNRDRLLNNAAIFPKKIPQVSIEYGGRLRVYKRMFRDVYVVTIPKYSKGNRENLRHEYRRAIALASIEAVQRERPDLHERLSLQFGERFRETQTLLNDYIMATATHLRRDTMWRQMDRRPKSRVTAVSH